MLSLCVYFSQLLYLISILSNAQLLPKILPVIMNNLCTTSNARNIYMIEIVQFQRISK